MSFILLGILNSQVSAAGGAPAMELISSTVLSSSTSSVTFSSIPQDYKHLQVRSLHRQNGVYAGDAGLVINSINGTRYHTLQGDGSAVSSFGDASNVIWRSTGTNAGSNVYTASVTDILDFSSTTKTKTLRTLQGFVYPAEKMIDLRSNLWNNTAAITTLAFSGSFQAGTRISLYGIRG